MKLFGRYNMHLTALEIELAGLVLLFGGMLISYELTKNALVGFFVGLAMFLYLITLVGRMNDDDSAVGN